jgi:hypothetical protein
MKPGREASRSGVFCVCADVYWTGRTHCSVRTPSTTSISLGGDEVWLRDELLRRASGGTVVTVLRAPTSTQEGLETAEAFRSRVLF